MQITNAKIVMEPVEAKSWWGTLSKLGPHPLAQFAGHVLGVFIQLRDKGLFEGEQALVIVLRARDEAVDGGDEVGVEAVAIDFGLLDVTLDHVVCNLCHSPFEFVVNGVFELWTLSIEPFPTF